MDSHETLDWHDGQPRSRRFGDVYFSRDGGPDETAHVFLHGNRLPERLARLPGAGRFVIAETGFGTGLNFLCAWRLFESVAPVGAQLDFVSTELYPLSAGDLKRALALWPALFPWSDRLLSRYGALAPGWHRFDFAPQRVPVGAVDQAFGSRCVGHVQVACARHQIRVVTAQVHRRDRAHAAERGHAARQPVRRHAHTHATLHDGQQAAARQTKRPQTARA